MERKERGDDEAESTGCNASNESKGSQAGCLLANPLMKICGSRQPVIIGPKQ